MSHDNYLNPFDDEQLQFSVLVNARKEYSLWPVFATQLAGWECAFGPASRKECLDYITLHWTSINPFINPLSKAA